MGRSFREEAANAGDMFFPPIIKMRVSITFQIAIAPIARVVDLIHRNFTETAVQIQ